MAINIPKPKFPNVPRVPGVPQLLRQFPAGPGNIPSIIIGAAKLWQAFTAEPTWGVFNNSNQQAIIPDSIVDFDYRSEYRVSNYPVQDGKFASYNKVANPFETSVRMSKSGTKADRVRFIQQLDAAIRSLNSYKILTPEKSYLNVNLTRYEMSRRGAKDAYFLSEVDLFFTEVRATVAQYTTTAVTTENAKAPGAKPPINLGAVSPKAVATQVAAKVKAEVSSAVGRVIR